MGSQRVIHDWATFTFKKGAEPMEDPTENYGPIKTSQQIVDPEDKTRNLGWFPGRNVNQLNSWQQSRNLWELVWKRLYPQKTRQAPTDKTPKEKGNMEKEIATHSSILAWKNPWTEESGGLKSMGLHDWACVHEGGGRWVGSKKLVELKNK